MQQVFRYGCMVIPGTLFMVQKKTAENTYHLATIDPSQLLIKIKQKQH